MESERIEFKPELYPKLVLLQKLSNYYFDFLISEHGLTNRKEFIAGHEFIIQYSNEFVKCSIWTDCDNYSVQFIDLYRIDGNRNLRIDFSDFGGAKEINDLYLQSSTNTTPLSELCVKRFLVKLNEYEELERPLKEYYETKGAKIIEQNFQLHSEFFKQHPELFKRDYQVEIQKPHNEEQKITVEEKVANAISQTSNLTFKEKLKKYLGI